MAIERGQYFTPDKRALLINEVKSEISQVDGQLKSNSIAGIVSEDTQTTRIKLQQILNGLFDKKGVVTPKETDNILDILDNSKRNRLQKDFYKGIKKSTIVLLTFGAIAVGVYFYMKKRA